jgi:transposase
MDMANRTLLFATEGRDAATVNAFKEDLIAHGGKAENIEEVCIDMHQVFINGLQAPFPNLHLTFDRFHVMKMANEAVDPGLEPFVKSAQTLNECSAGVLRWFVKGLTNGILEGTNSLIQAAKVEARAYRTVRNINAILPPCRELRPTGWNPFGDHRWGLLPPYPPEIARNPF